jgi:ATP-dependent exoDNAse (exonuclease V) alpha subunit
MKIAEFVGLICKELAFTPTDDQYLAMQDFGRFLADRQDRTVMIMRGSAGTGKTSLAGAMVRTLRRLGQKLVLMAPTGRAAKVFAQSCGLPAYTIHRRIYREKAYQGIDGQFQLNNNLNHNTLFIIDEASMISASSSGDEAFGSGSLLADLVEYVYGGDNCRMMLIGDNAQLPPVGEEESPALSADVLGSFGLVVHESDLLEVVRQKEESGILYNATALRSLITRDEATHLPIITFQGFADIVNLPGDEFVESLATSYSEVGMDETIVITRSNKRANIYNQGIRNTVLDREEALCGGDMLMVVRNNYFWVEREKSDNPDEQLPLTFLANGDVARVQRVRNVRQLYGFTFADVWMVFPDYDDYEMQVTVIMDSLSTDAPALTREQNEKLYAKVMEDYQDVPLKANRLKELRQDQYFNAVQVKYAYAVTCHKAQGGQWQHVYLDQGYMTDDMLTPSYIHWLYTAFTRATSKLFLVNWPKNQCREQER